MKSPVCVDKQTYKECCCTHLFLFPLLFVRMLRHLTFAHLKLFSGDGNVIVRYRHEQVFYVVPRLGGSVHVLGRYFYKEENNGKDQYAMTTELIKAFSPFKLLP